MDKGQLIEVQGRDHRLSEEVWGGTQQVLGPHPGGERGGGEQEAVQF